MLEWQIWEVHSVSYDEIKIQGNISEATIYYKYARLYVNLASYNLPLSYQLRTLQPTSYISYLCYHLFASLPTHAIVCRVYLPDYCLWGMMTAVFIMVCIPRVFLLWRLWLFIWVLLLHMCPSLYWTPTLPLIGYVLPVLIWFCTISRTGTMNISDSCVCVCVMVTRPHIY